MSTITMDDAHLFAQGLIANGWLNSDPDCVNTLHRQLVATLATPVAAELAYPTSLTPPLKQVLSFMNFRTGPIAHVFQAAGFPIPKKCEAEQAFVLDRMIRTVLQHGEEWIDVFAADLHLQQAIVEKKKTAALPREPSGLPAERQALQQAIDKCATTRK